LMDKLPSIGGVNLSQMGNAQGAAEKQFKQMEAIINSMTPAERRDPPRAARPQERRRRPAGWTSMPPAECGPLTTAGSTPPATST
ncbi:hypothetical protein KC218_25690, partial [Mycobacterium tuberculosis]|nr:hypothetical protein [Mycobacterium tuberculosis]